MAYVLSPEDRNYFEELLSKADPYPEDDPIWLTLDAGQDSDMAMATLAKMALEGRLK